MRECLRANPGRRKARTIESSHKRLPRPPEIKAFLDGYVIGQDKTKKARRGGLQSLQENFSEPPAGRRGIDQVQYSFDRTNRHRKTLLAQTLSRMLEVPFAIVDATTLTEAGYVGEDVENIILKLLQALTETSPRRSKGII